MLPEWLVPPSAREHPCAGFPHPDPAQLRPRGIAEQRMLHGGYPRVVM